MDMVENAGRKLMEHGKKNTGTMMKAMATAMEVKNIRGMEIMDIEGMRGTAMGIVTTMSKKVAESRG